MLVALQDSSTTKIKTGEENLLDISKLKCSGCTYTTDPATSAPFLPLPFIQAVAPSTANQIGISLCKDLASKFMRASLPAAACKVRTPAIPWGCYRISVLFLVRRCRCGQQAGG